jgi:hypothetical protein
LFFSSDGQEEEGLDQESACGDSRTETQGPVSVSREQWTDWWRLHPVRMEDGRIHFLSDFCLGCLLFDFFFFVSAYSLAQKEESKEIDFVRCATPVAVRFLVLVVAMEINIGLWRLLQGRWTEEATLQLSVIGSAGYQKLADDTWTQWPPAIFDWKTREMTTSATNNANLPARDGPVPPSCVGSGFDGPRGDLDRPPQWLSPGRVSAIGPLDPAGRRVSSCLGLEMRNGLE